MKFIFLIIKLISTDVLADALAITDMGKSFVCPNLNQKILLAHKIDTGQEFIVCGDSSQSSKNLFSEFTIYLKKINSDEIEKSIFGYHEKIVDFLIIKNNRGFNLIENFNYEGKEIDLYKHDILCKVDKCELKNEKCIFQGSKIKDLEKVLIKKFGKKNKYNKKLILRMKKAGCYK